MVFQCEARDLLADRHSPTEKEPASPVFHEENPDEQEDDGVLGILRRMVLGESVVPEVRLNKVKGDEHGVECEGPKVDGMQAVRVATHTCLGVVDQTEVCELVKGVEPPGAPPSQHRFLGEFPVVPTVALILEERNLRQSSSKQPDCEAGERAETNATPEGENIISTVWFALHDWREANRRQNVCASSTILGSTSLL